MREIKFRAWDKDAERMIYFGSLKDFGNWIHKWYRSERYLLLQYTGLKDKNGKEIWEGDIVEGHKSESMRMGYDFKSEVRFNKGCFVVDIRKDYYECLGSTCYLEIISNIYENPELMKKENGKRLL